MVNSSSKTKIIVPANLYDLHYSGYHNNVYAFDTSKTSQALSTLANNANNHLVINFDDKKDKRKPFSKSNSAINFNLNDFFSSSPSADITFTQSKESKSSFDIYQNQKPSSEKSNTTFSFLGSFKSIDTYNTPFKNMIFNNKIDNSFYTKSISFSSDTTQSLSFLNQRTYLDFENLDAKNLQSLTINNAQKIKFHFNKSDLTSLKKLDLQNITTVVLSFGEYNFESLNFEKHHYSSEPRSQALMRDLTTFYTKFANKDCQIILSPSTNLYCKAFLPEMEVEDNSFPAPQISVKKLFNCLSDQPITTTFPELLSKMFKLQKENYFNQLQDICDCLDSWSKTSPKHIKNKAK